MTKPLVLTALPSPFDAVEWEGRHRRMSWYELAASVDDADPNVTSLRLLATLSSRQDAEVIPALERLNHDEPLARGARLQALTDLKRYAEVMTHARDTFPTGSSQAELFDAANASFAVGLSASVLELPEAATHLHAATVLARALRMSNRIQLCELELEGARARIGEGNIEAIDRIMSAYEAPVARQQHANRLKADIALTLGDYRMAVSLVGPTDVRGLVATALLNGEVYLPDTEVIRTSPYAQLALALRHPDRPIPDGVTIRPFAGYAWLLRVARLLDEPGGADQAGTMLASIETKAADQLVMLGGLILRAHALGAEVQQSPQEVVDMIRAGWGRMTVHRPLALYLRERMPDVLMILAHLPGAPAEYVDLVMTLPLWVGNAVRFEGRVLGLPAQRGASMQARELALKVPTRTHSMKKKRYSDAWENLPLQGRPVVSLARVARAVHWAAQTTAEPPGPWELALNALVRLARGEEFVQKLSAYVTVRNT
ncbi:hypothetical protein [Deinococcus soli (ex Cha et al. 2016)]|uniref:Uncharacterized protein n=1 Tax=Deinococcus soli (ex Cha et al. 2016) TaxID=1309411 RepID=A0ACC6KNN3_9DEIO|nr:hypothetical protein [Deinococcus soli (ex Cha et al. 2016)]MDR6330685.1 hypothetical protein [Deinococcus soli (ex Cha et al. 2016)]MDR6754052.1 hypothetical protein [Deinococcus soli (ex Cha et al. 2016)]